MNCPICDEAMSYQGVYLNHNQLGYIEKRRPDKIHYCCEGCGFEADFDMRIRVWQNIQSPLKEFVDMSGFLGEALRFEDGREYVDPRDIRLGDPDDD